MTPDREGHSRFRIAGIVPEILQTAGFRLAPFHPARKANQRSFFQTLPSHPATALPLAAFAGAAWTFPAPIPGDPCRKPPWLQVPSLMVTHADRRAWHAGHPALVDRWNLRSSCLVVLQGGQDDPSGQRQRHQPGPVHRSDRSSGPDSGPELPHPDSCHPGDRIRHHQCAGCLTAGNPAGTGQENRFGFR